MKRLLIGVFVAVLALVVAAVGALMLVDVNHFRPQIQNTLSQALGRPVTLGKLSMSVFSGSLQADQIRIGDAPAFGKQPFVSAKSLSLGVRLWPLVVDREVRVTSLTLEQPTVRLLEDRAGRWNFADFGGSSEPAKPESTPESTPAFSVDALRINDGTIELKRAAGDSRTYTHVRLSADHVSMAQAFPFSMSADIAGGGTLKLDGKLGPWHAGDAMLTPVSAHLLIKQLDLVGAGLMSSSDGVGGVIDMDSQIGASKGVLTAKGRIDASKLKLVAAGSPSPRPVQVDYQADYNLSRGTGRVQNTTLGSGGAKLAVNGSFDNRGKVMRLDLRIRGSKLPIDDLQPLLPAFGVVLPKDSRLSGGTLGVNLHAHGALDALRIDGPVSVDDTRLAGYSLGSKMGGALSLAGIKAPKDTVIKHAEATLAIAPSGITADPASAQIEDLGSMTGKGTMAASGKLDFRMLVKLDKGISGAGQSGGLGGLLGGSKAGRILGGAIGGTSDQGIGLRIEGTASDPKFRVDPSAVAGLIKAGIVGGTTSRSPDSSSTSTQDKKTSKSSLLNNLLKDALKKKDTSGSGQ